MQIESAFSEPWADESLEKTNIAGRAQFANVVRSRIEASVVGQSSTVFGLVGPWGSGKTTLIKEVVGNLDGWKVVWFSPWSVADVDSISTEFVSALAEAFPQQAPLARRLAKYARFGTPALKAIPVFGDSIEASFSKIAEEIAKRPAWHTEFARLSQEIAELGQRVLIVVDDVDRLDGVELRSLLRVVRLLGRFTNVHYLLAYDQSTIDNALDSVGANGASSAFMEKIVQYPFEVPPTPMVVRRKWSRSIVDEISPVYESDVSQVGHRERVISLLSLGLDTPRAAERLRAQMASLLDLAKSAEVDIFDFTVLTWLRITHHAVWDHIRLNSRSYFSWESGDGSGNLTGKALAIRDLVPLASFSSVLDAVNFLFEKDDLAALVAGRRWRARTSRYFERYFHVGIADDDVSEVEVESALMQIATGVPGKAGDGLKAIMVGSDAERALLALETAISIRRNAGHTSIQMLDFLGDVQGHFTQLEQASQSSGIERWLAREIFLALSTGVLSTQEAVSKFGFVVLVSSAYLTFRERYEELEAVKGVYSDIARLWCSEVRQETLAQSLGRDELLPMTSLCVWVSNVESFRGFLASTIADEQSLLDIATKFVSFKEWVGSGRSYDVTFMAEEFEFATGDALTEDLLHLVRLPADVDEFERSDREDNEVTDLQRRYFAAETLQKLVLGNGAANTVD